MIKEKELNIDSKQERFEKNIKPILFYVGAIGAVLTAIAYIAIVFIMVFGFSANTTLAQSIVFAVINAIIGLIIMQFLKIQGIDFAKNIPYNKEVMKKYHQQMAKQKKVHSLKYFWFTSVSKDVVIKCITIAATTLGIIYVVIAASNNYTLLLLAVVNLLMFICFGLLSLVKAYDFYNDEHIPFIEEKINEFELEQTEKAAALELQRQNEILDKERETNEAIEAEVQRRLALAQKELDQQRNNSVYIDRGSDILDSRMDPCVYGTNSRSEILVNSNDSNIVLERTSNPSSSFTDRTDIRDEKNLENNKEKEECSK